MEIKSMPINSNNTFSNDYRNHFNKVKQYFHYDPYQDYAKRIDDLKNRTFKRDELAAALMKMNKNWEAGEATFHQIERLKDQNSSVIIGGQQAGLLTGPMYAVNKIISIIKMAKEQEKHLNIPVIPVFWIAGEDHDFDEINHVFINENSKMRKHIISQHESIKKSVSEIKIDQEKTKEWLVQFLNSLPETTYSREWFDRVLHNLLKSRTYVDFFARLVFELFPNDGLVLMDAHHEDIRMLEKDYLNLFIADQQLISKGVYETIQQLKHAGYSVSVDAERDDANLFYHLDDGDRILLKRDQDKFVGKNDEIVKTSAEMYEVVNDNPRKLSNNVITRPMMQELVFPVLGFIGGDGEISYWAALKQGFEQLNIKMPPVVPRLSFTFITNRIAKLMEQRVLEAEEIINNGTGRLKQNWLTTQAHAPVDTVFHEAISSIDQIHQPIRDYSASISPDLASESEKNFFYIKQQVNYLKKRVMQTLKEQYRQSLDQFDEIDTALHPNGVLQERIFNPYYFINLYGYNFIDQLVKNDQVNFDQEHYLIYL